MMILSARINLLANRILSSVIALASVGFGISQMTSTPTQAAPSVLAPFPSLYEALDSVATFTGDLNRTLHLLLSYNDTIAVYGGGGTEAVADTDQGADDAHGHDHELLDEEHTTPLAYQSMSLLSSALYEELGMPLRFSLYGEAADRIQRGLLIEALPMSVPVEGTITSGFGMRNHPILRGRRMHKGLDMAAPQGTSIFATGGGTVTFSGRKSGYGNVIIIDHGYGYTTLYAHCSKLMVDEGAKVSRGDLIALVGSTGRSTGPHLHYEVRLNDVHMNPELFLIYPHDKVESLAAVADHYLTF